MEPDLQMTQEQYHAEVAGVLRDYHLRQLKAHLLGPLVSVGAHLLLIVLLVLVIQPREVKEAEPGIVVQTWQPVPMPPLVEIPPELLKELDAQRDELLTNGIEVEAQVAAVEPTNDVIPVDDTSDENPMENVDAYLPPEAPADPIFVSLDVKTPLVMPELLRLRSQEERDKLVEIGVTSAASQLAVQRALEWLASIQEADGSWANSQGHTGMVMLVFLAHGETPMSERYGATMKRALQWTAQTLMNGSRNGGDGHAYGHGILTYAAAEAYAMTRIPMMGRAMEAGVARIIDGQQAGGGFNYGYGKDGRWDLSYAGWQIQALKAAQVAGCQNPGLDAAMARCARFLTETAYRDKKFGYCSPGTGGNMTGVGVVCLQILGHGDSPEARGAAQTIAMERLKLYHDIATDRADWSTSAGNALYGWYYDTQAMFNLQGKEWRRWQPVYERVLLRAQHKRGYWEVEKGPGMDNESDRGRILSTCWATMQLEVCYKLGSMHVSAPRTVVSRGLDTANSGLIIQ